MVSRWVEGAEEKLGSWSGDGSPRKPAFTFNMMKAPEGGRDLQFEEGGGDKTGRRNSDCKIESIGTWPHSDKSVRQREGSR